MKKQTITLIEAAKLTYGGSYDVNILDENNVLYERNHELERFVLESLAKQPTQLGEGVEWNDLDDGLDIDSKISKGLLTRKDSRGLVKDLLLQANKYAKNNWPTMSFIIGSPGIGKTRTLTYVLRQLLQRENVNVQYFFQKSNRAHLFLRRNGKTYAYETVETVQGASGTLFGNKLESDKLDTFILVDPNENGAIFVHPQLAHLIVSCSANSKHYHNIKKESISFKYYLGLPTTNEIEIMAGKLQPDMDPKTLHRRISYVGAAPRYLFRDDSFEERKKEIEEKAGTLNKEIDEDLVVRALTNGAVVSQNPTLWGALFAHVNIETTDSCGATRNYEEQRVSILSQYAAWLLYKRFRSALVQATITGGECDVTAVFEKLCAFDLSVGGTFKVATMKQKTNRISIQQIKPAASVIRVMASRSNGETRVRFVQPALKGDTSISTDYEAYDPPKKKMKVGPPFIVLSDGYAAIDFLNLHRQVFQVTMGSDHDMNGWVDLLLDAAILQRDKKGKLKIAAGAKQLDFYWVVPEHKKGWATRKPKLPTKADILKTDAKEKSVIDAAITKHVCQFVLFIEREQPQYSEFWSSLDVMRGRADQLGLGCHIM